MLRSITAALALCSATVHAAGLEIPDYQLTPITERVHVIHGPVGLPTADNQGFMNNPVIALHDEGVVVVDPGSSLFTGRMVIRQIVKLTDKPVTHVIGTHVHGDHWLGNHAFKAFYPEAGFYAHPKMIEMAGEGEAENWISLMVNLTNGATSGTEAVIPDQALADGQVFELPGLTVRVHLTEHAHTLTDAMVEFVGESVVVLGDNGLYGRLGRMDDGSFRGNIEALDRALELGAEWYVPGHGQTGGREAAAEFRDYLDRVYRAAVDGVDQMLAPFEIKEQVLAEFGPWQSWNGFDEEFGKHLSLAVLEAEQASF